MPVLFDGPGSKRWITVAENAGVRYLYLDGCEEGAMRLDSDEPVFDYLWLHKCSALAAHPIRRALILGAGSFAAAKGLALDHPKAEIQVLDSEPQLGALGRDLFGLDRPEFSRVSFVGQAAEEFLPSAVAMYDFIFDDVFDDFHHVPSACCNREHFRQLQRCLTPGGACLKNIVWDPSLPDSRNACAEAGACLRQEFANHALLVLGDPEKGHNLLLIGLSQPAPFDWEKAQDMLAAAGVPDSVLNNTRFCPDHPCLSGA